MFIFKNISKNIVTIMTVLILGATLLPNGKALGQTTSAQITGKIVDSSGAAIPEAKIVITNVETQTKWRTQSNSVGMYTVPQLAPGHYEISAKKQGFRAALRTGITLQVDQIAEIDLTLQVGSVSQTIQVSGEAPLLATSNPTAGQVINNREIQNLPLNGRSPFRLVLLTPGIHSVPSTHGQFGNVPVNTTDDTLISINGGPASANEIMIDGIPATAGFINQMTTIPVVDATEEFDVQSGPLQAEWGRSGGGVINVYTKSGTNQLHGDLFEFARNGVLDANNFFNKRAGKPIPPFSLNQYGFTLGGPVYIPRIYNGHNKTFFFVDYQGTRWREGETYITTVPTAAERQGNFSQTLDGKGQVIQIYNPFSTTEDPNNPGEYIRTAFPNDTIPASMIDPIAKKALSYVPMPNLPGNSVTHTNNFISNANRSIDEAVFGIKFNENVGSKEKLFERFSVNSNTLGQPNAFGNVGTPGLGSLGKLYLDNTSAGINSTTMLNPTTVLSVSYGFARFHWGRPTLSYGFDQTTLGFPSSLVSQEAYPLFPAFHIPGFSGIGGGGALLFTGQNAHNVLVSLMKSVGRHTLQFGASVRVNLLNQVQGGDADGNYNFAQAMTAGPNPNNFAQDAGSSFASFLLGTASSGSMGTPAGFSLKNTDYAAYAQDAFRVTKKLTLTYGLRYGARSPMTERRNELNWFNPNIASPARNSQFPNLTGGLVFASSSNRSVSNWITNEVQPRFGFAYHPLPHTVVHGGAGLMYMPLSLNPYGDGVGQTPNAGFSADTPMVATLDGVTPFDTLSNPFPNGLNKPSGSSLGASTYLGQGFNVWERNIKMPNVWQWNFGIQQQVNGFLFDVLYEGSKGTHLVSPLQQNALPTKDFALGSALQQLVPNPFYGIIKTGRLAQPEVTKRQLLLPYPQFTGITVLDDPYGNSSYNALAVKIEKRTSRYGMFLVSYTFSKEIANVMNSLTTYNNPINHALNTSVQNPYDLKAERSLSELDTPQVLAVNYVYRLPFGHGQAFFSDARGITKALISDWQSNGIFNFRSGYPLVFSAPIVGGGNRPNKICGGSLSGGRSENQRLNEWFNTACFVVPPPFTFGDESRTDAHLRGPKFTELDFALQKNIPIKSMNLMVRGEAFNLFNTPHFFQPDTAAGSLNFGRIQSTTGHPRIIQLAVKFRF